MGHKTRVRFNLKKIIKRSFLSHLSFSDQFLSSVRLFVRLYIYIFVFPSVYKYLFYILDLFQANYYYFVQIFCIRLHKADFFYVAQVSNVPYGPLVLNFLYLFCVNQTHFDGFIMQKIQQPFNSSSECNLTLSCLLIPLPTHQTNSQIC